METIDFFLILTLKSVSLRSLFSEFIYEGFLFEFSDVGIWFLRATKSFTDTLLALRMSTDDVTVLSRVD